MAFEPFDWAPSRRADGDRVGGGGADDASRGAGGLVTVAYRFYRRAVSSFDGARCGHHPTCSAYAVQAVRRWGLVRGAWLALQRITSPAGRSSALRSQPIVLRHGVPRYLDRLEDHDFWLAPRQGEAR